MFRLLRSFLTPARPGPFYATSGRRGRLRVEQLEERTLLTVDFGFAASFGSTADDFGGPDIAVDAAGNTYALGVFRGTVDFDPGPGTFNMTSAGAADTAGSRRPRTSLGSAR